MTVKRFNHAVLWRAVLIGIAIASAQAQVSTSKSVSKPLSPTAAIEPVEMRLERKKIVQVDGKEIHEPAEKALPGDTLLETVSYRNRSKSVVKSSEVTLPIPANTELIAGSIRPASAKVSIDGIKFADFPLKRKVRQANGVQTEIPIPMSDYRYIRWYPGDLDAGKVLFFSARFKVSNDKPPLQSAADVPLVKTVATTK